MNTPSPLVQVRYAGPLGPMILAASERGLAGAWFDGQRHLPDCSPWPEAAGHPVLQQAVAQFAAYFAGTRASFDLPLDLARGTAFQQAVWRALLTVRRGETISYSALGRRAGCPAAVRAVGAAVGRNPLSVVVPCHRVLGADGSLTGYAGGLDRKRALLQLEGAA
ncbi:methylated-DNA--[protein]-cysteine S-methyltransferase [Ramlibacter sp.]|uniref:methylated-DNA--[protein]-cysteine S-methyltransferase n=1 Tax=Ramlibacter sp. TaxID=1917967 RepID=UPI002B96869A|nr:methylated-DNA--[protein]-cysteine S-methyltransferase [Ramlibacter sp.]HWI82341.1 methylated-DNA--[protein]-cysteine S-methyltransferase [Ramlibacter sp.]